MRKHAEDCDKVNPIPGEGWVAVCDCGADAYNAGFAVGMEEAARIAENLDSNMARLGGGFYDEDRQLLKLGAKEIARAILSARPSHPLRSPIREGARMSAKKEGEWSCRRCGKKFAHDKLVYQSYVAKTGTCKKCTPAEKEHLRKMLAAREKKP